MADSVMPAGWVPSGGTDRGRLRSAVTTVVRPVTVAAGVFAPGHLSELARQPPFELVDAVLEQTRATERRLRILPSREGVYFVVALALFPGVGFDEGVGETYRRPRRRAAGIGVGQGVTGSASPDRRRTAAGALRRHVIRRSSPAWLGRRGKSPS